MDKCEIKISFKKIYINAVNIIKGLVTKKIIGAKFNIIGAFYVLLEIRL
jgi:hypothetical protein